jgi:two-component system, OmpR family, sensor kinase
MLGLLALAAVGLLVVDAVSYAALRSYLYDRTDQQVESALMLVGNRLIGAEIGGGTRGEAPPPQLFERQLRNKQRPRVPVPPPLVGVPGSGPPLPPGIFGEIRTPSGKVKPLRLFGQRSAAKPELPADIPVSSSPESPAVFTVPGTDSSEFRAAAFSPGNGLGTVVAAVSLQDVNQTLSHLRLIGGIVTVAVLAALAALAWWVIRVGLRPLERMQQTANAIAAGDLSARVETTDERTEVGRLGASLNAMLGQIERAFAEREASEERLRRFLADASHELRTPLTSIRGYAEAFRLGPARDPDELEKAMSRIEDEAARMGVLVGELLTLARLDEVRERVRRPVDLPTVAAEACADARAANPGRRIDLTVAGRAEVIGDEGQLHQVVANLLRNAVQHTPGGTPVDVSVSASAGEVTIAVRDHGEGLPPGAADHAFERFWRHERSQRSDDGGAGLGLAIVSAIAEAHGGHAVGRDAPAGGAVFEVVLPAR